MANTIIQEHKDHKEPDLSIPETPTKPKKVSRPRAKSGQSDPKKFYVNNAALLEEISISKQGKTMPAPPSNKLAKMLYMIADRYSTKSSFGGYSFREDMVAIAVMNLMSNWYKFDAEKGSNPFAFYTTAVHRSFLQCLADEKKHRDIRDSLLVQNGANPSFGYQERGSGKSSDDLMYRSGDE